MLQLPVAMACPGSSAAKSDPKDSKKMDEGEASKSSMAVISSTVSTLKRQVLLERQELVKEKLEANMKNLQTYCAHFLDLSKARTDQITKEDSEKCMLHVRMQRALCRFGNAADASEGFQDNTQDDLSAPILFGGSSGTKAVVKPIKMPAVSKIPPYTTWIFLDRNQRMADDQSVVGRRRIYYDSAGNEALICSDSEEEQVEEEEEKHEFSKGDDYVIWKTVKDHGFNKNVVKALGDCIEAKASEIEARYEVLLKEDAKRQQNEVQTLELAEVKVEGLVSESMPKLAAHEEEKSLPKDLTSAMDSFDNLFCRRCLVFDCRLHGCSQALVVPSDRQPSLPTVDDPIPCGRDCYHLPRPVHHDVAGKEEFVAHETGNEVQKHEEAKGLPNVAGISKDVIDNTSGATADRTTAQIIDHPRRGIKDKRVNALRKLLKRKTGKGGEEDAGERRPARVELIKDGKEPTKDGTSLTKEDVQGEGTGDAKMQQETEKALLRKLRKHKKSNIACNQPKRPREESKSEEVKNATQDTQKDGSLKDGLATTSILKGSNWSTLEKGLYEKGLQIFGRNSCMIARNLLRGLKSCIEVGEYMYAHEAASLYIAADGSRLHIDITGKSKFGELELDIRSRSRIYNGRRRGRVRRLKYTWKSAGNPAIRKRVADGKDQPCKQFTPCSCLFLCGKQCSCLRNGTCCEKYCGCSKGCKNRFRGCHCAKSQCCSRQCPCFAAGRECDPDVCRNCWVGCGDGTLGHPPQRGEDYQCHNMKLLLKQQQKVLLGRSDVAGWGAFLKSPVNKHEYLGEYTGELISHREADKRGKIYDRENSSFLFNLNDQYVLDACRKGDKLKFANHSPNPNCYAKVIMVAGDHRVGIFAKEKIGAGEELFYDYRYEPDRAPVWARKPEDGPKHDDVGNSSGMSDDDASIALSEESITQDEDELERDLLHPTIEQRKVAKCVAFDRSGRLNGQIYKSCPCMYCRAWMKSRG